MSYTKTVFAVLALLICCVAKADVRPISDAERAAVQIAAEYLASGPQAVAAQLSASSRLRALGAEALPAEIEARLGPPHGAEWELVTVVDALKDKTAAFNVEYPSGVDETVFFDLVREGEGSKIADIRILAMPSARGEYYPSGVSAAPVADGKRKANVVPIVGIAAALLALAFSFVVSFHRLAARVLLAVALLGGSSAITLALLDSRRAEKPPAAAVANKEPSLAPLLLLRRALAEGGSGVDAALAAVPNRDQAGDVARLWGAQWNFQQGKLSEVERTLNSFPVPSSIPLVEIIRARLALSRNDPAGAIVAYQRAINLGPGRDSLWMEASSALFAAGFEKEAGQTLRRVAKLGSRDADVYYLQAMMAKTPEESETHLKQAWAMLPAERGDLLASGLLWSVVRKRGPMLIDLSKPREAAFAAPGISSRPIAVAVNAMTSVSGDFLHVQSGEARLYVQGGAALAPIGTPTVDAGEWSRIEEAAALRAIPALLASPPATASYMQPAMRERIRSAADALATRNRWSDLVQLTQGISPKSEFVPSSLFMQRATALQRVNRGQEARQLLMEVAASPVLVRKRDVYGLEQLADMLASEDMFAIAVKMLERAKSVGSEEYADLRITQVSMDERLAKHYSTHASPHFEIHYPSDVSPVLAAAIADTFEAELKRLQRWIPVRDFKPVVVNIVWWQEFKSTYTGSENILGFYNGKITVPLAGIYDLHPVVVALMTHELCHAMIAQATGNQAPRWFHEGLAQRVEMVPYHANAFNMYEDEKLLATSVLDPVLNGSRDGEMVGAAYVIAQTYIRYLEHTSGEAGLRSMTQRFAAGETTEEAILAVTGRSLADVDASFRTWGKAERRVFENAIAVRYDQPDEAVKPVTATEKKRRETLRGGQFYMKEKEKQP